MMQTTLITQCVSSPLLCLVLYCCFTLPCYYYVHNLSAPLCSASFCTAASPCPATIKYTICQLPSALPRSVLLHHPALLLLSTQSVSSSLLCLVVYCCFPLPCYHAWLVYSAYLKVKIMVKMKV